MQYELEMTPLQIPSILKFDTVSLWQFCLGYNFVIQVYELIESKKYF